MLGVPRGHQNGAGAPHPETIYKWGDGAPPFIIVPGMKRQQQLSKVKSIPSFKKSRITFQLDGDLWLRIMRDVRVVQLYQEWLLGKVQFFHVHHGDRLVDRMMVFCPKNGRRFSWKEQTKLDFWARHWTPVMKCEDSDWMVPTTDWKTMRAYHCSPPETFAVVGSCDWYFDKRQRNRPTHVSYENEHFYEFAECIYPHLQLENSIGDKMVVEMACDELML